MPGIGIGIRIGGGGGAAYWTPAKLPTGLTPSFLIPSISGKMDWTDNTGGVAQYEVSSSTGGAAYVVLTTTVAGATTYTDTTCKQNNSVVYRIRGLKGTEYSDYVVASALVTPLCWKTNQTTLTAVTLTLNITAGKTVNINWGDGTNNDYTGNNSVTKNYSVTGNYDISVSGDVNFITNFTHQGQAKSTGVITNWTVPTSIVTWGISSMTFTGDLTSHILPAPCIPAYLGTSQYGGGLPQITPHATIGLNFQCLNSKFTNCGNLTTFKKAMTIFYIQSQTVAFPTTEIDKILLRLANWYQVNAPTANCSFAMDGANMGIPTGGASNVDLVRLAGYYTAAGKTATITVRTS